MTAPVINEVSLSDGPFCESSFVVSFYVPKKNQATPTPAKGLRIQKWKPTYVAVRHFGGFVSDFAVGEEAAALQANIGEEAAALQANIAGTVCSDAIEKSHGKDHSTVYTVAQYNSPSEFDNRVNEIWLRFDMEE